MARRAGTLDSWWKSLNSAAQAARRTPISGTIPEPRRASTAGATRDQVPGWKHEPAAQLANQRGVEMAAPVPQAASALPEAVATVAKRRPDSAGPVVSFAQLLQQAPGGNGSAVQDRPARAQEATNRAEAARSRANDLPARAARSSSQRSSESEAEGTTGEKDPASEQRLPAEEPSRSETTAGASPQADDAGNSVAEPETEEAPATSSPEGNTGQPAVLALEAPPLPGGENLPQVPTGGGVQEPGTLPPTEASSGNLSGPATEQVGTPTLENTPVESEVPAPAESDGQPSFQLPQPALAEEESLAEAEPDAKDQPKGPLAGNRPGDGKDAPSALQVAIAGQGEAEQPPPDGHEAEQETGRLERISPLQAKGRRFNAPERPAASEPATRTTPAGTNEPPGSNHTGPGANEPLPVSTRQTPVVQETDSAGSQQSAVSSRVETALQQVEQQLALLPEVGRAGGGASSGNGASFGPSSSVAGPGGQKLLLRVVQAMRQAVRRRGVVRLKLHPPELGSVQLQLRLRRDGVEAKLQVETSQAQQALLDNLHQLRQRLAEQDVKILRFEVDLMNQPFGHSGNGSGPEQQRSFRRPVAPERPLPATGIGPTETAAAGKLDAGGVDVVV